MRHKLPIAFVILGCAIVPVSCQTNKEATPSVTPSTQSHRFYGLVLSPAIMVEYGLTRSRADMYSPARIVAELEFDGNKISGAAGYTHSDCGIHSGGALNGTIKDNRVHLVWNFTQETGPTKAEFDGNEDPLTHEISGNLKYHNTAHLQEIGVGPMARIDPDASGTFRLIPAGKIQNQALATTVDHAIKAFYVSNAHKHFNNGRSKGFYIDDTKTLNAAAADYRKCIEACALIDDQKVRSKELCAAYNNLGVCEQRLGHKDEAAKCYEKAFELVAVASANSSGDLRGAAGVIKENQASLSTQETSPKAYYGTMVND